MPRLVLTVIGDDRPGLVRALAEVVASHDGNWERSQLSELAGKFAGIVVVDVPHARADDLARALRDLDGMLDVTAYPSVADGSDLPKDAQDEAHGQRRLVIDLLGNDRPGIVREVSAVLADHDLSIETITTGTREAPMAGGLLFDAHVVVDVPAGADTTRLRADLERLATELLVDIAVG